MHKRLVAPADFSPRCAQAILRVIEKFARLIAGSSVIENRGNDTHLPRIERMATIDVSDKLRSEKRW